MYTDDLVIISPSSAGLSQLLRECEKFGTRHDVKYSELTDWSMEFRSLQPQDMLSRLIEICLNTSAKLVPVKRRYAGLRFNSRIPRNRGKTPYEEEKTYRCATAESDL